MAEVIQKNDTTKKNKNPTPNPTIAILCGIGATIGCCLIWIFVAQKFKINGLSLLFALAIASAIKYGGKANKYWYGIIGATLSVITALIGNLATAIFIMSQRGKTPLEILKAMDISTAILFIKAINGYVGIIFYIGAIIIGFWFSFYHPKKPIFPE
ncbi:MAG: hypothetical protein N2053_03875 [Chitinispirillaceae bacterium]|nr:hypothetical protein [Chitinispirillaceae bacterium]